jgi:hypothetical protein
MHQYRQVLCRIRLGDTDRSIARSGLIGRRKSAELRQIALDGACSEAAAGVSGCQEWTTGIMLQVR